MAIRIEPVEDRRAQEILDNASRYFDEARQRTREAVEREIARERGEG